jgi:hypothetical protein
MKTKNLVSVVVLFILFCSFKSIVLAQGAGPNGPIFVLQGAVKQKGRSIQGVELVLLKEGKQVAKIITPRNGLYYFQLNKSSTDSQSEYVLKINKQGSISGVLRVNTYVPKEQFTTIPYLFNLDIAFNPESTVKKDFGRIKWFVEKNAFDFDRNYIPVPEKDTVVADTAITSNALLSKDSSSNSNSIVQNNSKEKDSSSTVDSATLNPISAIGNKQTEADAANKTFADIVNTATTDNSTNVNLSTNDVVKLDKSKNDKSVNSSSNSSVAKSDKLKNDQVLNTSFIKNPESTSTSGSPNNKSVSKTESNGVATKNNSGSSASKNQLTAEQQRLNTNEKNKAAELAVSKNNTSANSIVSVSSLSAGMSKRDSLAANSSIQKDLFFLTGVPMGQFKTNLPSPNQEIKNAEVYAPNEVYSTNSERSKYFSEKLRFERKKAENLAKKHETNNTLTSLLNVVDEFDKKNK